MSIKQNKRILKMLQVEYIFEKGCQLFKNYNSAIFIK